MTTNNETDRVNDAIARSISHNEIVRLPWSQASYDALRAACENYVDTHDHRGVQFWGTDEGDQWRVHLHPLRSATDVGPCGYPVS